MRAKVERTGLCMGCHQEALNEDLWSKVSKAGFLENEAHQAIMGEALRSYSSGGSKGLE